MSTTPSELAPFTVHVPQDVLDDLRARLKATRFAPDPENENEVYGLSTAFLRPLVEYWADGFDWRAAEARLNAFHQHRVDVGGTPVHFVHERGRGPAPIPLLLLHGWPWLYHHWNKVIGPLTDPAAFGGDPADAFDVVVPSLPGFGFSTPLTDPRENYASMADRFHTLMTDVLGYGRFGVGAADYGALVGARLGHKYAGSLYGVHLGNEMPPTMFQGDRSWDLSGGQRTEDLPPAERARLVRRNDVYVSHVAAHLLDGQTLTHGLNDSPAGTLAWIVKRYKYWSDRDADFAAGWPVDDILTFATIIWVTESIGSSIRAYKNASLYPPEPVNDLTPYVQAPAGFTFLLGDSSPGAETPEQRVEIFKAGGGRFYADVRDVNVHKGGGHFGPYENPGAWIHDLRSTYRKLR
ncbi:epoxide hydrolase family protein [Actinacidiphila rubida]|uniref:Pimeloyl-ACP methyl ester carboxylesterase n=1 Tax=Actinacidiphila rubida TaxID=310780 RepID=A0A1H8EC58_9ACTN|nr:epoxide hydrolase family protein [Actinacidiphila rubida]SEN17006.1 Pimeloyl-ACP methyl ester carboxylesterase [Actinacidiphila rubida]